ncbi:MAG: hypothetical protein ACM3TU_00395 [Bacillota bacterium]
MSEKAPEQANGPNVEAMSPEEEEAFVELERLRAIRERGQDSAEPHHVPLTGEPPPLAPIEYPFGEDSTRKTIKSSDYSF